MAPARQGLARPGAFEEAFAAGAAAPLHEMLDEVLGERPAAGRSL